MNRLIPTEADTLENYTYKFTIPGDPVPHASVTYRSKWMPGNKRAKKAARYKAEVQMVAKLAKVELPKLTKMRTALIHTTCYFRNGRHADPESVHKCIKDALWPAKQGGDKWTGGSYDPPMYDASNPRVEVTIRV